MDARRDFDAPFVIDPASLRLIAVRINKNTAPMHIVAIKLALKHGKTNPEEIDYINAHATSTGLGDICETKAIKLALGEHAKKVAVSATKSVTGHLLGAAGGVELAASAMAIQTGIIPPTINLENQDPECDLDCVPNIARKAKIRNVLSNSFGFGGHNATLLLKAID